MLMTRELLALAIKLAVKRHKGQFRKGDGRPYVTHPLAVAEIVKKYKKTVNPYLLAICCILHDVVEDCDVSLKTIAKYFGYKVAAIAEELTTNKEECEKMGKAEYLSEKMLGMSSYALCIKLADRLHNVGDMSSLDKLSRRVTKRQTLLILENLNKRKLTATHKALIRDIKKQLR